MKLEPYNLSTIYQLSNKNNFYNHYIIIVFVFFILLITISTPYQIPVNYNLYINDNYKLIVDDNFFPVQNKKIYINHKSYSYNVLNIAEAKNINNKLYYEVEIDLKTNKTFDKNILNVTFLKRKKSILNQLFQKLKGW